jgi:RHS repeat-associated protein
VNSVEQAGGIGGLLALQDLAESRTFLYFADANGNISQLIETTAGDNYGGITASYEYDAYGRRRNEPAGEYVQPYRFSSKTFDEEIRLGYWGYRWVDLDLGRWLTRDPITDPALALMASSARNSEGLSRSVSVDRSSGLQRNRIEIGLYEYLQNAPLSFIDPTGLRIRVQGNVGEGTDRGTMFVRITVDVWPPACCRLVRFVQQIRERSWRFTGADTGWIPDPQNRTWYPNWSGPDLLAGNGQRWTMEDFPGKSKFDFLTQGLIQEFQTCALCIRGSGQFTTSCLIGCVSWGHSWTKGDPDYHHIWGPETSSPIVSMANYIKSTYFPNLQACPGS